MFGVVSPYGPLSAFLLVIRASGLCTPGPVHLDGVDRLPTRFLLRGIRRAAPAQVTACRVVTVTWLDDITTSEGKKERISSSL